MGKKSRRSRGAAAAPADSNASRSLPTTGDAALQRVLAHPDNLIPRQRILYPEDWNVNMASLHPTYRPEYQYICYDAEKYISKQDGSEVHHRNRAQQIEHYSDCAVCFKDATKTCTRCGTVSYCSQNCQLAHWKQSHKKACQPNPKPYRIKLNLEKFRVLSEDCLAGHEFLVVKTTERFESLQQICDEALESADDLFDIPGFGANQLNVNWYYDGNQNHAVCRAMRQKFGWTSGNIGLELVCGYRAAESRIMYSCLCDDAFQMETNLPPSYYGRALFPPMPPGKHVRGNLVVYKVALRNKQRLPQQQQSPTSQFLNIQMTDDADLQFEFILFPMNKAELAFMLSERCKALDQGAYTTRMWRYPLRAVERQIENEAAAANGGLTLAI